MNEKVKAVGYVRASSQKQTEQQDSIAAQKSKISEYAKRQNIEIVKWFEAVGFPNLAPGNAFQYLEDNPDVKCLVVTSADRLERWSADFKGACDEYDVELVICDSVSHKKEKEE